jgi:hypothetical protein
LIDDVLALFGSEGIAGLECAGVFIGSPIFHLRFCLLQVLHEFRCKTLVITGNHRVRRQGELIRQIVALTELEGLEVQHLREQNDSIEGDAAVDKIARHASSARGSVTFAEEIKR